MRICYFTKLNGTDLFRVLEYLHNDVKALRELGHEVVLSSNPFRLPRDVDLYFAFFHIWGFFALPYKVLFGKPLVVAGFPEAMFPPDVKLRRPRDFVYEVMERICIRHATVSIASSEHEKEFMLAVGGKDVKKVYLAVDTELYRPDPANSRKPKQILSLFSFTPANNRRKCLEEILAAARIVHGRDPDVTFLLSGGFATEGMERHYREKARDLGLSGVLEFTGRISPERKLTLLRESAVFLHPTRYEGFGLAIAEAMSCALPVVASPEGSVPEILGDCGYLCDGRDPEDIARVTLHVLSHPGEAREIAARARERVMGNYPPEGRKDGIRQILDRVMTAGTP